MRDTGGRAAVFAPLDLGRRADAVVRRLSDGIRLGLLRPGEQLPSESELAETFGVAPVTVREALTTLREQQLVVTRRGRTGGSFVRNVRGGAADVLRERLREIAPSQLRDLADHYVAVFGTSAHLAAERAGAQDVLLLTEGVAELRRAPDADARRRAESRFHVAVAAAAQSARLTREVISLQSEVGPLLGSPRPPTPHGPRCTPGSRASSTPCAPATPSPRARRPPRTCTPRWPGRAPCS